jgi:hypothetical protein
MTETFFIHQKTKFANSYLRYKCKKLSFILIARTGLKYERGSILKDMSAIKELFTRMSYNILTTIVRSSHRLQHKFVQNNYVLLIQYFMNTQSRLRTTSFSNLLLNNVSNKLYCCCCVLTVLCHKSVH